MVFGVADSRKPGRKTDRPNFEFAWVVREVSSIGHVSWSVRCKCVKN